MLAEGERLARAREAFLQRLHGPTGWLVGWPGASSHYS